MLTRLTILLLVFSASICSFSQVTTSTISGTIKDINGENLVGATIAATHQPTGTIYRTSSLKNGVFNLVNLIPGGPYSLTVSFIGHENFIQDNITLPLGENTRVDASLKTTGTVLEGVVVSVMGAGNTRKKTGASTNIGRQQIDALPTLSRSLSDITRITPQATGSNSFGGTNNRFNNITIDGAVNNDVFGLASSGTPGGQANTTPISLDAIQEVQVVLAPYDITYGNFTGGGVNAVTRSGTNNYEGSVYYFLRNEGTVGKDPVTRAKTTAFTNKQYGVRFGGPIIKSKLFFFANGELARVVQPTLFNAGETSALITTAQAQALADTLMGRYNYDVGTYNVFQAKTQSDKVFGRIDWNITDKHHLTLRHNYIKAYDDNISRTNTLFRFGNNTYRFNNKQNITVAEVRSRFSNALSNDLILGLHRIRDFRTTFGQLFPSIEISHNSGTIQLGSERSSTANELDQDIFEVTDNFKIFKGKNTFTIGTHNEFFKFRNLFINNYNGRWRFASLNDFYGDFPRQFDVTFSANKTANARPSAEFKAGQLGFYAQDEIQFTRQFRLTMGFRVDVPQINTKPAYNPIVDSTFNGAYSTSNTPNGQLLYSPRIGFNYDIEGNRTRIVRGGIGIFSGRLPFVWLSNQFSNTGLLLKTTAQTDNTPTTAPFDVNGGNGFNPDVNAQSTIGSAGNSFEADLIDKKFKLPQVMRVNLGFDIKFPGDINFTIEALYSKTLNNVFYQDVNLTAPVSVVDPAYNNGFDTRIAFASSTNARRKNPAITNAILISNTNKGYTYNIGFIVNKTLKNFFGQIAYNHNGATDVNSGASSTALSQWEFVQVVGDPNHAGLAISNYALKHRISAVLTFSFNYAKHFKTSIGLFYSGNSGTPFTYLVNGDLNSDGRFGNDLVYVPADPSQINFVDRLNSSGTTVISSAADQSAAFEQFVQNDPYLRKIRGQYTDRNGRSTPWEHVIDARIAQDIYITAGGKKHTLEVSFDIFNLTNLINKNWGRQYSVTNQAYNLLTTINRTSGPFAGKGYNFTIGQTPWSTNFGARWQGQLGIRYTFD